MNNEKIDILSILDDILFCKNKIGEWQFNRMYHFYEGYFQCLLDYNVITLEEYQNYNDRLYKTFYY